MPSAQLGAERVPVAVFTTKRSSVIWTQRDACLPIIPQGEKTKQTKSEWTTLHSKWYLKGLASKIWTVYTFSFDCQSQKARISRQEEADRRHHTERTAPDSDEPRSLSPVHVAVTGFVWFTPWAGQHLNQCQSSWRPLPPPQATFRAPAADAHAAPRQPQRYMIFNPKSAATKLPSEWFAASPPLCSWGARTKTPPTFFVMCGREIKAASFILMFNSPSSPPLFGYTVWPLLRNRRGVGVRRTFCSRKRRWDNSSFS